MSIKLKWSPGIIASDYSVGRTLIHRILNYSANCRQLHCLKKTNFHYLSRIVYFCMIFVFMIPDMIRICTDAPAFTRSEFDCSFVVLSLIHISLAFTGHKSLLGLQGIGGFLLTDALAAKITPLISAGAGSISDQELSLIHISTARTKFNLFFTIIL